MIAMSCSGSQLGFLLCNSDQHTLYNRQTWRGRRTRCQSFVFHWKSLSGSHEQLGLEYEVASECNVEWRVIGNDQETELPGLGRLHFLEMELQVDISHRPERVSISDNDVAACIWFNLKARRKGLFFADSVILHATVESCAHK